MKALVTAIIEEQTNLGGDTFRLTLRPDRPGPQPSPGQFYLLRPGNSLDPLLGRPLSISDYRDERLVFRYRVRGKGTGLLARLKPGQQLNLVGPLGRGFDFKGLKTALLVGGGLGAAPLYYLARELSRLGLPVEAALGAATREELLDTGFWSETGVELKVATLDGSAGKQGLVTDLLPAKLNPGQGVFACGPRGMLQAVAGLDQSYTRAAQVSLEAPMACGVGACLGCVTRVRGGEAGESAYARVCTEGPVFKAEEVVW